MEHPTINATVMVSKASVHLGYVNLANYVLSMGHLPGRFDQEDALALTPRVRLADERLVLLCSCVCLEVTVTDEDKREREKEIKKGIIYVYATVLLTMPPYFP